MSLFTHLNKRKKAFTLLELLVAVAIFAGIAVLTLGIFARTAASSAKTNKSRQRTEAVRNLVDKISNDFRYIYLDKKIANRNLAPINSCLSNSQILATPHLLGYQFTGSDSTSCLEMVLKYPGSNTLTWKKYFLRANSAVVPPRTSVYVQELRNCSVNITSSFLECPGSTPNDQELLNSRYQLEPAANTFSGLSPIDADKITATGILGLKFSLKPVGQTQTCAANATECYTITTTLAAGARWSRSFFRKNPAVVCWWCC